METVPCQEHMTWIPLSFLFLEGQLTLEIPGEIKPLQRLNVACCIASYFNIFNIHKITHPSPTPLISTTATVLLSSLKLFSFLGMLQLFLYNVETHLGVEHPCILEHCTGMTSPSWSQFMSVILVSYALCLRFRALDALCWRRQYQRESDVNIF